MSWVYPPVLIIGFNIGRVDVVRDGTSSIYKHARNRSDVK